MWINVDLMWTLLFWQICKWCYITSHNKNLIVTDLEPLLPWYPEISAGEEAGNSMSASMVNPTFIPQLIHARIDPWVTSLALPITEQPRCKWQIHSITKNRMHIYNYGYSDRIVPWGWWRKTGTEDDASEMKLFEISLRLNFWVFDPQIMSQIPYFAE